MSTTVHQVKRQLGWVGLARRRSTLKSYALTAMRYAANEVS